MCEILRGNRPAFPLRKEDSQEFLHQSDYHGVQALLYYQLMNGTARGVLPHELHTALHRQTLIQTAYETMRQQELRAVLNAIGQFSSVLLMKGTPLAFTHYPSPVLRYRVDTDLLVRKSEAASVESCLKEMGYTAGRAAGGELLNSEKAFVRQDGHRANYVLDLHWRISSSQRFANSFDFKELYEQSIAIRELGTYARGLGNVHALILACMHRIAHMPFNSGNRLIWLYDIHLLGEAMTTEQWAELIRVAQIKQLSAACADGLSQARQRFGSSFDAGHISTLAGNAANEPLRLPGERTTQLAEIFAELRVVPTWRDRILLVSEHLFPSPDYMYWKYQSNRRCLLPFFYLHRALTGTYRRARRRSSI